LRYNFLANKNAPRYPETINPISGDPSIITVKGVINVEERVNATNSHAARNLPITISYSVKGRVINNSKVPFLSSSDHNLIVIAGMNIVNRIGIHKKNCSMLADFMSQKELAPKPKKNKKFRTNKKKTVNTVTY
jgi:hypothetical protein